MSWSCSGRIAEYLALEGTDSLRVPYIMYTAYRVQYAERAKDHDGREGIGLGADQGSGIKLDAARSNRV
jgi:hypothetical protein